MSDYQEQYPVTERPDPTMGLDICRMVHYTSYGSSGGEYPATCRAAVVTQVWGDTGRIGATVFNPTGFFLHENLPYADLSNGLQGGTWHWHTDH